MVDVSHTVEQLLDVVLRVQHAMDQRVLGTWKRSFHW